MAAVMLSACSGTKSPDRTPPLLCMGLKFQGGSLAKVLRRSDLLAFHFLEERIYGLVHRFSSGVFEANHSFGIDNVNRRPTSDCPSGGDWAAGSPSVPE